MWKVFSQCYYLIEEALRGASYITLLKFLLCPERKLYFGDPRWPIVNMTCGVLVDFHEFRKEKGQRVCAMKCFYMSAGQYGKILFLTLLIMCA